MYTYSLEISNNDERIPFNHEKGPLNWEEFCNDIRDWLAVNYPSCIVCRIYDDKGLQHGRINFVSDSRYKPY